MRSRQTSMAFAICVAGSSASVTPCWGVSTTISCAPRVFIRSNRPSPRGLRAPSIRKIGARSWKARTPQAPFGSRCSRTAFGVKSSLPGQNGQRVSESLASAVTGRLPVTIHRRVAGSCRSSANRDAFLADIPRASGNELTTFRLKSPRVWRAHSSLNTVRPARSQGGDEFRGKKDQGRGVRTLPRGRKDWFDCEPGGRACGK